MRWRMGQNQTSTGDRDLYKVTKGDAYITSDVDSIRCLQPNIISLISQIDGSTLVVWGTMGFGLFAAMGDQIELP